MGRSEAVYERLPVWAQHAAVSAFGLYWHHARFGRGFMRHLRDYLSRESWTHEQWERWQRSTLSDLLSMAAAEVPYYSRRWGPAERKAAAAGELADIPLLEKADLRADPLAFVRRGFAVKDRLTFHTSGSTGTPIKTIWSVDELRNSLALREARSARWAGVSFRDPRATFSGRMVEPDPASRGPFHRYNVVERQVYLSAFHLGTETAETYLAALRRHRVVWMTGYAFSFYTLARHVLERSLPAPGTLRAIVTTSEKVTPQMRSVTEEAFGCRVFEEYSTVENALFASECPAGNMHVSPDAGFVEILDPSGRPCPPGVVGEVVATCLMRRAQPLIRFRLGDLAAWAGDPCPCGRAMPVVDEVVGRVEDVVVGPDGREMVRFHGLFLGLPGIHEGQVVQERLDHVTIKVVASDDFSTAEERVVRDRVAQRLGPAVGVTIERVQSIPRTAAGKFQAVVSRVRASPEPAP